MPLLDNSYIILITGAKDAGKTAFAHLLGEKAHSRGWNVCILPYKQIPPKLLPSWMKQQSPRKPKLTAKTVYILDDFHLIHHARTTWRKEQISANRIMSIARHLDLKFIITTQITKQLDVSNIYDIDIHFLRKPATGHLKAERVEVRPRVRTATNYFIKKMKAGVDPKTICYYFTLEDEGSIEEIPLPTIWSDDLSKYLSGLKRRRTVKVSV